MGKGPISLGDQLNYFKTHGMTISKNDTKTLGLIGFYRLKEYAAPLVDKRVKNAAYSGVKYSKVISRYRHNRQFCAVMLTVIGDVVEALRAQLTLQLARYGQFGYLDLKNWMNYAQMTKKQICGEEKRLVDNLSKITSQDSNYLRTENWLTNADGVPAVGAAVNLFPVGELVTLLAEMSSANRRQIAVAFSCHSDELLSWFNCLKNIRNMCAHNNDVIDVVLDKPPMMRKKYERYLYHRNGKTVQRLATVVYLTVALMNGINPHYHWSELEKSLRALCSENDKIAHHYGFANANEALQLTKIAAKLA